MSYNPFIYYCTIICYCNQSNSLHSLIYLCCAVITYSFCWFKYCMVFIILFISSSRNSRSIKIQICFYDHSISFFLIFILIFLYFNGCFIISLSASHSQVDYTIDDLIELSSQPSNIFYCILYLLFILFLLGIVLNLFHHPFSHLQGYFYV